MALTPKQNQFVAEYTVDFNATAAVITFERRECFSRGFRLGVQLILAGLQDSF